MLDNRTALQFVSYLNVGDHIEYKIAVKDPHNQTYELQARYRTLRDIYNQLKENKGQDALPDFPPKRLFGNMNVDFVSQRQKGLEQFFNSLLQKFSLEELQPLRNFLKLRGPSVVKSEDKKVVEQQQTVVTKKTDQTGQHQQQQQQQRQPAPVPPPFVIDQYKNLFFDLNDNFAPPEMEDPEVRRKKNRYESNIKIDIDTSGQAYKLPAGNESNLISIQDETIVLLNPKLVENITNSLDDIRKHVKAVTLPNIQKIIVTLE